MNKYFVFNFSTSITIIQKAG